MYLLLYFGCLPWMSVNVCVRANVYASLVGVPVEYNSNIDSITDIPIYKKYLT